MTVEDPSRRRFLSGGAALLGSTVAASVGGTALTEVIGAEGAEAATLQARRAAARRRRRLRALQLRRRRERLARQRELERLRRLHASVPPTTPAPTTPAPTTPAPTTPAPTTPAPTTPAPTTPAPTAPAPAAPAAPAWTVPVPSSAELHYLNRLGCGYTPATYAQLRAAGSATAWLEAQLDPSSVPQSAAADALGSFYPDMDESASAKWVKNAAGTKGGWVYAADFAGYSMLRQIYSTRQVFESLVGFWSDHFHVHADHDTAWVYRKAYDDTIRAHALGTFEDLLVACSLHPAMLLYLDNWTSVRNAPNENQGRELLELHTVGRASGYTEAMVKDSAKILSGYTVDAYKTWASSYVSTRHTTGPVQVLGFTAANAAADGSAMTVDYLKYLAHHPATATRIATKLARAYVTDSPSDDLVSTVAAAFTSSGTDIRATLHALVAHPDFAASRGTRVRNPVEDFVATCRVLGVQVQAPTADQSFARACIWVPNTTLLYQWPRPDGLPRADAAWASATRMLNSFRMHWNLAAGWWPTKDVTYRKAGSDWLPTASLRLDAYVDHLSRLVLGRTADARIQAAVVSATGYPGSTVITSTHAVATWLHVRVMGLLLDSPDHMSR